MNQKFQIEKWFEKTWGGGLVLPSGWFGRPYDSIHQLSSVFEEKGRLRLYLDEEKLKLDFEGRPEVDASDTELIIRGFDRLKFEWIEYGADVYHSDEFRDGVVKILAPPGA